MVAVRRAVDAGEYQVPQGQLPCIRAELGTLHAAAAVVLRGVLQATQEKGEEELERRGQAPARAHYLHGEYGDLTGLGEEGGQGLPRRHHRQ